MNSKRVLVVDDDPDLRDNLKDILKDEGYIPFSAATCSEALDLAKQEKPLAALLDIKLPDGPGTTLLGRLKEVNPDCICTMMTAYADLDSALSALEQGAFHYLQKPVRPVELVKLLERVFETVRLREEKFQAEKNLRESEGRFRAIFETAQDVIYIKDLDFKYVLLNPGFEKLHDVKASELIGKTAESIYDQETADEIREVDARVIKGEVIERESTIDVSGGLHTLHSIKVPMRDASGKIHGICGIAREITETKRLERQFLRAQKMEAVGTLAGGIAHDFNNLLMGIQGNASLMLHEKDPSDFDFERLKNIEQFVRNGADLTKQLLAFGRGGKYEVKPSDLNDLIRNTARMFGRTKKEIAIHEKYQPDLWTAETDQGQIEQVLMNLFVNAWHAMPGGGELFLETQNVILDENDVNAYQLPSGKYLRVSVSDSGLGMDKRTKERIFEPFFTTKEMGRGTGLGLASAYGIVKNHDGMIDVFSEKGEGTRFDIYLPATEREVEEVQEIEKEEIKGSETILLVDDENMILDVGREFLKKLGYKVLLAGGGQEAIDVYESNKEGIDLVILDIIMPNMSGGEVYDRLRDIDPDVKVLLSSGYSIDGKATEILNRGCDGFIQKPFDIKGLSKKIREILDKE